MRIVPWAPPVASAPEQAAAGTVGRDARRAAAARCGSAGITVSLAPVADVPSVPRAALAGRSFSRRPERASEAVAAAVAGWRAGGIAPTAKHFPGLGGAKVNTDDGAGDDRADAVTDRGRRPAAVPGGDPGGRSARDDLPRALSRARRAPHRLAVAARSSKGCSASELGFRGVVDDGLDGGAGLACDRQHHRRHPSEPCEPARTCCC